MYIVVQADRNEKEKDGRRVTTTKMIAARADGLEEVGGGGAAKG